MKILCVIDSLGSGGAQRQMTTVARLLKAEGLDVSVVCFNKGDFYAHVLEKEEIPLNWVFSSNYIKRIFAIRKVIRKGDYDAVISFLEVPDFLNNFAAIGGKSWKVITSERSSKEATFHSLRGRIFGWFQRYSDAIVCNSHNSKTMWQKHYPNYANKLSVIYNPVILPVIKSEYIPRHNGKLNVVIAASYQYLKNPIGLANAFSLLNEEEKKGIEVNWYGRIEVTAGDTEAYDEAVEKIKEHNLENIIHLNGPVKEIALKMYEADGIALFSELEGLPNAICEGMMIGKPIIMSRVSDYATLVDETNGFLCDWDNPLSIKEALVSAINLKTKQLIEMGKKSKEKAEKLFSPDVIVNQWINLIEK